MIFFRFRGGCNGLVWLYTQLSCHRCRHCSSRLLKLTSIPCLLPDMGMFFPLGRVVTFGWGGRVYTPKLPKISPAASKKKKRSPVSPKGFLLRGKKWHTPPTSFGRRYGGPWGGSIYPSYPHAHVCLLHRYILYITAITKLGNLSTKRSAQQKVNWAKTDAASNTANATSVETYTLTASLFTHVLRGTFCAPCTPRCPPLFPGPFISFRACPFPALKGPGQPCTSLAGTNSLTMIMVTVTTNCQSTSKV